jgi:hypothetical protein
MAILHTDNVVALRPVETNAQEAAPLLAAIAAMTQALDRFAVVAQAIGAAEVEDEPRARLMAKLGHVTSGAAELQLAMVSLHFGL